MAALDTTSLRILADRAFAYAGRTEQIAILMRAAMESCRWQGPGAEACAEHARRTVNAVRAVSRLLNDLGYATRSHALAVENALAAAHAARPGPILALCLLPAGDRAEQVLAAEQC